VELPFRISFIMTKLLGYELQSGVTFNIHCNKKSINEKRNTDLQLFAVDAVQQKM
jgi:hypothetical protein